MPQLPGSVGACGWELPCSRMEEGAGRRLPCSGIEEGVGRRLPSSGQRQQGGVIQAVK